MKTIHGVHISEQTGRLQSPSQSYPGARSAPAEILGIWLTAKAIPQGTHSKRMQAREARRRGFKVIGSPQRQNPQGDLSKCMPARETRWRKFKVFCLPQRQSPQGNLSKCMPAREARRRKLEVFGWPQRQNPQETGSLNPGNNQKFKNAPRWE